MKDTPFIKFLGTAGARYVVARQLRASGGVYISAKGQNIILDPGPGTLIRCATSRPRIDITGVDAIILTHAHIDHSNDVNILIDAITEGGLKKQGTLFATRECLEGDNAVVLKYLRGFLNDIVVIGGNQQYRIGDLTFSTSLRHQHPAETYGIKFDVDGYKVFFMVDTRYFPELLSSYKGANILIMNVVRFKPHESGEVMHLCLDDVKEIISSIRPQKAIMTHFGMTMLRARPYDLARDLTDKLGAQVIAASDGMRVELE